VYRMYAHMCTYVCAALAAWLFKQIRMVPNAVGKECDPMLRELSSSTRALYSTYSRLVWYNAVTA